MADACGCLAAMLSSAFNSGSALIAIDVFIWLVAGREGYGLVIGVVNVLWSLPVMHLRNEHCTVSTSSIDACGSAYVSVLYSNALIHFISSKLTYRVLQC